MLASQYHTDRLASWTVIQWARSYGAISHTHKKTQRVNLGVIRGEDQYGTGPSNMLFSIPVYCNCVIRVEVDGREIFHYGLNLFSY